MNFSTKLITKISAINQKLSQENLKITCAESCTGGLLSGLFTEIEGSSKIFDRGFVVYSNQSKIDLLNVDKKLLEEFGAVSEEVALAMARGALENSHANIAIAITGIAGPTGATLDKKVGTIFIALVTKNFNQVEKFIFGNNRNKNRNLTLENSLIMLENLLQKNNKIK
jgi:nicotinamide-nucleotide amidase